MAIQTVAQAKQMLKEKAAAMHDIFAHAVQEMARVGKEAARIIEKETEGAGTEDILRQM